MQNKKGEDRRVRKKKRMDKMKREKGKVKRVWIRSEGTNKKEEKRK